ncbi:MocE family 2Fe-2S type ferredoxin [Aneurinibacillus sp. Ricciae_BoGa-3]|uniref:MocE family 2Fe-2S type ferredoxin n=1 Tax=Aneurinibacillus sp. Ricciae_BoGa-3 TaxID=3022697 RepID=UPI00233F7F2F|nr:MocE family 2Fe-2S type ferredoxin [Aneurinibacillus sp. Ricciae_BoGa-3]WCK53185.1 MocE family 2Fe-2S type ferredoxin [Aneurinibacillus sp. Ricciae_BoGa-3]
MNYEGWIETCDVDDIEEEDVIRFDYEDRTFAIYRTIKSEYYATDGYCTHERFHLADGLVMGTQIECPKHNGRLDFTTGEAKRAPICESIRTYPVKIDGGKIFIKVD